MIGHILVKPQKQKLTKGKGVGAAPLHAALEMDGLEGANEMHTKVAGGMDRRPLDSA